MWPDASQDPHPGGGGVKEGQGPLRLNKGRRVATPLLSQRCAEQVKWERQSLKTEASLHLSWELGSTVTSGPQPGPAGTGITAGTEALFKNVF